MVERALIKERVLHPKDFWPIGIIALLEEVNLLASFQTLGPFVKHIVLDFYVNLWKGTGDPTILDFQKVLVWGQHFDFSLSIINRFLQCPDPMGPQRIPDLREVVSVLTHGKLSSWLATGNLSLADMSIRYSILHKIGIYNWLPRTHKSAVAKIFCLLLFLIDTK